MSVRINGTTGIITPNIDSGSYNQGQLAGFRNKVINGAFLINQRGYVSGTATTNGQYTLDMWKVTTSSGITYSTVNNKRIVTIPSGQTLTQIIQGDEIQTGNYVLSWEGTSVASINGGVADTSGKVKASLTGGSNVNITFGSGTVANVQLELGDYPTVFEFRNPPLERFICMGYYEVMTTTETVISMDVQGTTSYTMGFRFAVQKRGTPTILLANNMTGFGSPYASLITPVGMRVAASSLGTAASRIFSFEAKIAVEL